MNTCFYPPTMEGTNQFNRIMMIITSIFFITEYYVEKLHDGQCLTDMGSVSVSAPVSVLAPLSVDTKNLEGSKLLF